MPSAAIIEKFPCDHCGKQFAWKPELAGKKAKCKCGHVLTVPKSLAAAPLPPPPAEDRALSESDFDNYDFSEAPEPSPAPVQKRAATASVAYVAPRKSAVAAEFEAMSGGDRKDRFSFWAMCDVPRDIVAPIVMLVVGFGGIVAWAVTTIDSGPLAIFLAALGTAVVTVIKTALLTYGAIYLAPRFELSFGDVRTAILKMAAIVVFSDGVSVWLPVEELSMGKGMLYGVGLKVFVMGALAGYLFDMERNEVGLFAAPMGLLSYAFGVFLMILADGAVKDMKHHKGSASTPAAVTAPGSSATILNSAPLPPPIGTQAAEDEADAEAAAGSGAVGKPVGAADVFTDAPKTADPFVAPAVSAATATVPPAEKLTPKDRAVEAAIGVYPTVREARDFTYKGNKPTLPAAEAFYAAGAPNVYVDIRGRKKGKTMFGHLYVQLPTDPAGRAACFAVASTPAKLEGLSGEPQLKDVGQQYLVFDLPAH